MSTKSLLEKARESARRARARAHQRIMYGGDDEPIADYEIDQEGEDFGEITGIGEIEEPKEPEEIEEGEEIGQTAQIKQAVDQAIQRARQSRQIPQVRQTRQTRQIRQSRQVPQFRQMPEEILQQKVDEAIQRASEATQLSDLPEQEGGVKNMEYLRMKAQAFIEKMKSRGDTYIPSEKTVMNSFRSYVAYVNGKKLEKRYFHGAPKAAASKVLTSVSKTYEDKTPMPSSEDKPIVIDLVEVTKGVHKSGKRLPCTHEHKKEKGVTLDTPINKPGTCGQRYRYKYYAWREKLTQPMQHDVDGGERTITTNWKNIVIPVRKGNKSLTDALAAKRKYVEKHNTDRMTAARQVIKDKVNAKRATLEEDVKRFPPMRTYMRGADNQNLRLTGEETSALFKLAKKETKTRRSSASAKRATTMSAAEWKAAHPKKSKAKY